MFTDVDVNILTNQFTEDADEDTDVESMTSANQQPTGLEHYIDANKQEEDNINETFEDMINNSPTAQLENGDTDHNTQNNDHMSTKQEVVTENEEHIPKEGFTIDVINILTESNTSQIAIQHKEETAKSELPTLIYILRKHPTKQNEPIFLEMAEVITGVREKGQYTTIHPKLHSHLILKQMNIKEGLLALGEK